jgi:DNA modification methylase
MKTNSQDKLVIKPIDRFIEPFKRKSAVHYGFHSYFTTQPFNVVQEYIKNFTNANELVADPFVGSGVTAVEALRLKRRCFALDLNPFAVFLTKAKCSYANINKLTNMFNSILKRIESKCEEVEKIPLEDSTNIEIPYWYPNNVLLPSDSDVLYLHEIFTKKQLFQLSLIKSQIDQFPSSNEKDLLLILFCGTLSRANMAYSLPADGRTIYSGDFTIFHTGRYRIPKKIAEIPVLPVFKRRFLDIIKAKKETNADFRGYVNKRTLQLVEGSATNLKPYLTDSSVDYVYTDPPYGGHIKYLDLSTIYNAWLNLDVTEEMRTQEAIEGGERKHTFGQYMELMSQSLTEIARILKQDRWLSLIYHYREPYLWTNIVETAKKVGLEYQNSVVQHTKLPSWHKIDVPQTVLSSQMVINFKRKYQPFFEFKRDNLTLQQLIFNVAEREIIKRDGATLEDIINALIPELFEHNFDDQTQTRTDKVFSLLAQEFRYDTETRTFQVDRERGKKLGSYIPLNVRVNYYLISYLRRKQKATLEEIIPYILPRVINGETPSGQEILEELKKIAHFDGHYWVYREAGFQSSFALISEKPVTEPEIPQISEHNQMIYRLALLASKYGFIPKIGDQEQKEPFLKAVNLCADLHFASISDKDNSYINNIDCLWMAKANDKPLYAFEVEHTTNIRDAFERFLSLLKVVPDVGYNRNLILVISRANSHRFDTAVRQSSYIGAPNYINNKIRYIFEETLTSRFHELLQEKDHTKFTGILSSPELG